MLATCLHYNFPSWTIFFRGISCEVPFPGASVKSSDFAFFSASCFGATPRVAAGFATPPFLEVFLCITCHRVKLSCHTPQFVFLHGSHAHVCSMTKSACSGHAPNTCPSEFRHFWAFRDQTRRKDSNVQRLMCTTSRLFLIW